LNSQSLPIQGGFIDEIKLIPAVCPRCGANLTLPEGSQRLFCMYCGTQIIVGRVDSEARIPCRACQGYGRVDTCRACNGSGQCTWSSHSSGARNDIFMLGYTAHCEDGICSACGGSGKYALAGCPGCNGTGKCPQCLGTGKCHACNGVGNIPNPNGYETCGLCNGTGMIDAGAPKGSVPSAVDKCPSCGKELHDDNPQCPYCGFLRRKCPSCGTMWVPGTMYCQKCGFGKASDETNPQAEQ